MGRTLIKEDICIRVGTIMPDETVFLKINAKLAMVRKEQNSSTFPSSPA